MKDHRRKPVCGEERTKHPFKGRRVWMDFDGIGETQGEVRRIYRDDQGREWATLKWAVDDTETIQGVEMLPAMMKKHAQQGSTETTRKKNTKKTPEKRKYNEGNQEQNGEPSKTQETLPVMNKHAQQSSTETTRKKKTKKTLENETK